MIMIGYQYAVFEITTWIKRVSFFWFIIYVKWISIGLRYSYRQSKPLFIF